MAQRFREMQDRKREFGGGGGGGRNRYGNRDDDGGGRFFGLGSIHPRGDRGGRSREKPNVMNSGSICPMVFVANMLYFQDGISLVESRGLISIMNNLPSRVRCDVVPCILFSSYLVNLSR